MSFVIRQEAVAYGLLGFMSGEDAAREYHDGLKDDGDGDGTFHLVDGRNGYVYDPTLTQDADEPERWYRPPFLTTDVVNIRSPNGRMNRVIGVSAEDVDDRYNVLCLVGGRVSCFIATGRGRPQRDQRFARGFFVDGAVAWGHTQTGDPFPPFRGKKPKRFWDEDEEDGRSLHIQRCGVGALVLRRVMRNRAGEPTHLRSTVVTIAAHWHDKDPHRDHLLMFETATFHQDAPAHGGLYLDPVIGCFEERFQGPLERALALYREHCRTPGIFSRARPVGVAA